jgi:hypothetical protein
MIPFDDSQFGYPVVAVLVIGIILTIASVSLETIGLSDYMIILAMVTALVLFYKLNIQVERGFLTVSFGQGMIAKRIRIAEIAACKRVTAPWFQGWGGRIYNLTGTEAVEITFTSGKKLIVGAREAETLYEVIEEEKKKYGH